MVNNCYGRNNWYNLDVKNVIAKLDSDSIKVLSREEVEKRLERYGKNELPEPEKH